MLHHVRLLGKSFSTGWTFVRFDSCNLVGLQIVINTQIVTGHFGRVWAFGAGRRNTTKKNRITKVYKNVWDKKNKKYGKHYVSMKTLNQIFGSFI